MITKQDIFNYEEQYLNGLLNEERNNKLYNDYTEIIDIIYRDVIPLIKKSFINNPNLNKSISIKLHNKFVEDTIVSTNDTNAIKKPRSAFAVILENNKYEIYINSKFSRILFIYSELIQDTYQKYWRNTYNIEINNENEIRNFIFSMWILFILCHELGHIVEGHLDFLISRKMIDYYDSKLCILDGETKEDEHDEGEIWKAIEAEADTYGTQAAFSILPEVKIISNFLISKDFCNDIGKLLSVYGDCLCSFYHLFSLLYSEDDRRHPDPYVRMYISATSFKKYIEIKEKNEKQRSEQFVLFNKTILRSYDNMSKILEFKDLYKSKLHDAIYLFDKIEAILANDKLNLKKFRLKH